ncbi:MAG: TonB-dependent receptor, partial [Thermodesulfobacteriota bacterium]|nr:TonB-dependent receptor [Thermodesulfobacteriota bacterium]
LGSFEQGRTLVLMDGVPINKTDSGGVNWHCLNPDDIERIEIFKGPGSSVYGGNAMGGVINLITGKPVDTFSGQVTAEAATHDTYGGRAFVSGRTGEEKGFYYRVSGLYRDSDGFESASDDYRASKEGGGYEIIPLKLEEWSISPKIGYDFNELNSLELEYSYYYDDRGEGVKGDDREDGEHRHFTNSRVGLGYKGGNGDNRWKADFFYQLEEYYTLYDRIGRADTDVDSDREDYGLLLHFSTPFLAEWNTLGIGADLKQGGVDAQDIDDDGIGFLKNEGIMRFYSLYLQNEMKLADERLRLSLGVRYDYVDYKDGKMEANPGHLFYDYIRDNPIRDENWDAVSPRISGRYFFTDVFSAYTSYGRGFRAPELDDMCRTGWQYVGPKIANPNLESETIDTFEVGSDWQALNNLKLAASAFYSIGKDFLYYVDTGIPIAGGGYWATRNYQIKQNVGEVEIYGLELDLRYNFTKDVSFYANYTYSETEITDYDKPDFAGAVDLESLELRNSPKNIVNVGAQCLNRWVNANVNVLWKDEQYMDDANTENETADNYTLVDLKFWRDIGKHFTASLAIENVFDEEHTETTHGRDPASGLSMQSYNPGRVFIGMLTYRF